MPVKPKIIFLGDYARTDYLGLLDTSVAYFDFYFLNYASPAEEPNKDYTRYGIAIYWQDYTDATVLLRTIKPGKVLFLYNDTYNQIVLNLACRQAGIPTFLLEHGLRADYVIGFSPETSPAPSASIKDRFNKNVQFISQGIARVKTRLFLKNSLKNLSVTDAAFVKEYIAVRRRYNYVETYKQIKSAKRMAEYHISFSQNVLAVHREHDGLYDEKKIFYIGIPYFDKLAHITATHTPTKVILIDQPLAEHHLLKWTGMHKEGFIKHITAAVSKHGYTLYVKPHPKQNVTYWQKAIGQGIVKLINDEELQQMASEVKLVLGFYSTYLLPFAAMPHTTLITFENHPAGRLDVSKTFIEAGVAHPVYNLEELPWALENIKQLHQRQLPNKEKFSEDWLYKFDGKAGERLRDILLRDDL